MVLVHVQSHAAISTVSLQNLLSPLKEIQIPFKVVFPQPLCLTLSYFLIGLVSLGLPVGRCGLSGTSHSWSARAFVSGFSQQASVLCDILWPDHSELGGCGAL